jgi:hypothetical protein
MEVSMCDSCYDYSRIYRLTIIESFVTKSCKNAAVTFAMPVRLSICPLNNPRTTERDFTKFDVGEFY